MIIGLTTANSSVWAQTVQWQQLNQTGKMYAAKGDGKKSLEYFSKGLLEAQKSGISNPATAISLMNIGQAECMLGDFSKAITHFRSALDLLQKLIGVNHPSVAAARNGLAIAYQGKGLYRDAENEYIAALKINNSQKDKSQAFQSLNGLCTLYLAQGKIREAKPFCEKALELAKTDSINGSTEATTAKANMAAALTQEGNYAAATQLFESVIMDREQNSPNNPTLVIDYDNFASVCERQGKTAQAMELYDKALKLAAKTLAPNHPDAVKLRQNAAQFMARNGAIQASEPVLENAVKISSQSQGENHPDTVAYQLGLAQNNIRAGYTEKAKSILRKLIADSEKRQQSPVDAIAMNDLAGIMLAEGNQAEAEKLFIESLNLREKLSGNNHADVARALNNLADLYRRKKEYSKADSLFARAVDICDAQSPEGEHMYYVYENYAKLLREEGQFEKAALMDKKSRNNKAK